jgi:hypothetical protein
MLESDLGKALAKKEMSGLERVISGWEGTWRAKKCGPLMRVARN